MIVSTIAIDEAIAINIEVHDGNHQVKIAVIVIICPGTSAVRQLRQLDIRTGKRWPLRMTQKMKCGKNRIVKENDLIGFPIFVVSRSSRFRYPET